MTRNIKSLTTTSAVTAVVNVCFSHFALCIYNFDNIWDPQVSFFTSYIGSYVCLICKGARKAPDRLSSLWPCQVSTSVQLKMSPTNNWEAWTLFCKTFSDLKTLGRPCSNDWNFSFIRTRVIRTRPRRQLTFNFAYYGRMYRTCICILRYFTLIYTHPCTNILSSSCEAWAHAYTNWVTHHTHILSWVRAL